MTILCLHWSGLLQKCIFIFTDTWLILCVCITTLYIVSVCERISCDRKTRQAFGGQRKLSLCFPAAWPLQDLRKTRERSCRTHHRFSHRNRAFDTDGKTIDQVTLLTQDIDDSFSAKNKAGTVLADLTAAYDTVCQRGLTWKLLRLLVLQTIFRMTIELVDIRSITLTTGTNKRRKLRTLVTGTFRPATNICCTAG